MSREFREVRQGYIMKDLKVRAKTFGFHPKAKGWNP